MLLFCYAITHKYLPLSLFFSVQGTEAVYRLFIPRLRVKREWFKGINLDPNDHSHPDVGSDADDSGIGERANIDVGGGTILRRKLLEINEDVNISNIRGRKLQEDNYKAPDKDAGSGGGGGNVGKRASTVQQAEQVTDEAAGSFEELFAEDDDEEEFEIEHEIEGQGGIHHNDDGMVHESDEWLDDELVYDNEDDEDFEEMLAYNEDFLGDEEWEKERQKEIAKGGENEEDDEETGDNLVHKAHDGDVRKKYRGHHGKQERPPLHAHGHQRGEHHRSDIEDENDDYFHLNPEDSPPDIDLDLDQIKKSELWEDELHQDLPREKTTTPEILPEYVWIDAHVMASPAIGDIDGDGREELVVPVSYFFDPGDYATNSVRTKAAVGKDGDPGKYLASGVVAFDLHTRGIKWSQHLDLSTRYTRYKAAVYGTPTLADLDQDGLLEVIVGTSMGWVYVLHAKTGQALEGWPVQLGDVQGQVAVGDIDGDGWLEMIAADARGSVAALRISGKEVWERHLGSAVGAGATLGDVDGDGALEVVVGTYDGRIHVLDAATGKDKPGFPFRTYGRITTPILITKLSDPKRPGMQLVTTSHDGFLYVIDSLSGCADSVDLGEPSYAMVLADDLANSGRLDLLVATAGGNIYALRTPARFQPLKAWPAQVPGQGTAGFTARWDWEGVYVTATSRLPRDVRGEAVPVRLTIIDKRPPLPGGKPHGPYKISVTLQGVGAKEMGAGDQPIIGMSQVVNKTGTYTLEVPCPRTRTSATIHVEMRDETGAIFLDDFALSFHIHFYRMLKWLAVGPFAFTAAAVLLVNGKKALRAELPS